jgi:hypothetical protein
MILKIKTIEMITVSNVELGERWLVMSKKNENGDTS